ncbi:hypothetical protein BDZ90DRAFT_98956 [Jaminaea rosea]|uniref:Lipid droplet-associated perilipin protein n=1 Tax=Jaminaea rosea TaxID=1569628 RepID=A0A316UH06_9BASI|nr:hypothetical protein BDZ90DRAFT_98956 [Jaminaea rosea]PWN24536.1 hypothetical protein BDZ90DRAFT_98956 [Jaminaea rosea]
MAATASAPSTNGTPLGNVAIHSNALNKIVNVPLVHGPLSFAYSTIEAHPLISRPYHLGEDILNQSIKMAEPITSRLNGQLTFIDTQAVKALEFAESKWSYPFKATPTDVANLPRSVINAYVDALQKAWDARVAPQVNQAHAKFEELKTQNPLVARAADAVQQLQANLTQTIQSLKNTNAPNGEKATQQAQNIVSSFLAELEKVRGFAATLPVDARKRFEPVVESINTTYGHLNKEVREGKGPLVPRLQKVLEYVQREAIPDLRKAVMTGVHQPAPTPATTTNGAH